MQKVAITNVQIEEILKEVDSIYGTNKCKEVIRNYASYIQMKKEGKLCCGTYNIFIKNNSVYDGAEQLVEVIWKLLKASGIVKTTYKYLEKEEIRKNRVTGERKKMKENFSNARCVRNVFEKIKFEQADRIAKNSKDDINLIKKVDVENVVNKSVIEKPTKKVIGFAC